MYFITIKRMLEVCFSAHPNIQYRAFFCFSCTEGGKKDIIENHIEKLEN